MSPYGEGNPLLEAYFREVAEKEGQEAADKLREEWGQLASTISPDYRPPWIDPPEMPDRYAPKAWTGIEGLREACKAGGRPALVAKIKNLARRASR